MSWKVPFVSNIPIEKEREFNEQINAELEVEREKTDRIRKTFNNLDSGLRKVADYLWVNLNKEISYEQMGKDLNIPESSCKIHVGELNFFNGFPITMIPVPKKTGWIKSVLDNEEDYEKWDRKKLKTITSMTVVRTKAQKTIKAKRTTKKKVKQKVKIKEGN